MHISYSGDVINLIVYILTECQSWIKLVFIENGGILGWPYVSLIWHKRDITTGYRILVQFYTIILCFKWPIHPPFVRIPMICLSPCSWFHKTPFLIGCLGNNWSLAGPFGTSDLFTTPQLDWSVVILTSIKGVGFHSASYFLLILSPFSKPLFLIYIE